MDITVKRPSESFLFHAAFGASGLLVLGSWLWAWIALRDIHSPLILHFSDYTGINQIGGMADIHGLGITGTVIVGLNFFLARTFRMREAGWAKILAWSTLFIAILLFTALAAIISVNQ